MISGAFKSNNLFKRLFLFITRLYKSFKSDVANLPPSSGTKGLSSGGITGTVSSATSASTATNANNVDVAADTGTANHPLTFIDKAAPDGGYEALKANATITANPGLNGGTITCANFAGNASTATSAATVSQAAQSTITSVGTLTSLTVSGDLTVDTNTLKVDSTNNKVGIGTNVPKKNLVVAGDDAVIRIGANLDGDGAHMSGRLEIAEDAHATTGEMTYGGYLEFDGLSGSDPYGQLILGTRDGSESDRDIFIIDRKAVANSMRIKASQIDVGTHFIPASNNTYDLGSSANRFRNIYTNDLNLCNEGRGNDIDGTSGNWTIQEGEDNLYVINNLTGKKYKMALTPVDED